MIQLAIFFFPGVLTSPPVRCQMPHLHVIMKRERERKKRGKESLLDWLFVCIFLWLYKRFYGRPTQEGGNRFSSFINQKVL